MGQVEQQTVLFLCTGNYDRGRFAEVLFNSVAARMGLPWRASSRGLALERGINNVGPMASFAVQALNALGVRAAEACNRIPAQVNVTDLEEASLVIALSQEEHLPLFQERFPASVDRVEFWRIADAADAIGLIEQEVMQLVARLFGGGVRREPALGEPTLTGLCLKCSQSTAACACELKKEKARGAPVVKVGRETKGRRSKGVTTVWEIPLDEAGIRDLAARLKDRCGTGGTVKDGRIEIQGDQRDRVAAELEKLGYKVKRVGG